MLNNTILLLAVNKFDPDSIIVNINKLKRYLYLNDDQLLQAARTTSNKSAILLQSVLQNEDETKDTTLDTNFLTVVIAIRPVLTDPLFQ